MEENIFLQDLTDESGEVPAGFFLCVLSALEKKFIFLPQRRQGTKNLKTSRLGIIAVKIIRI